MPDYWHAADGTDEEKLEQGYDAARARKGGKGGKGGKASSSASSSRW